MSRLDAKQVLAVHIACSLIRGGHTPEEAAHEADLRLDFVIEDLVRAGAPLGRYLRQIRVYELRCQGLTMQTIADRMGIARETAHREYRAEMLRKRGSAA